MRPSEGDLPPELQEIVPFVPLSEREDIPVRPGALRAHSGLSERACAADEWLHTDPQAAELVDYYDAYGIGIGIDPEATTDEEVILLLLESEAQRSRVPTSLELAGMTMPCRPLVTGPLSTAQGQRDAVARTAGSLRIPLQGGMRIKRSGATSSGTYTNTFRAWGSASSVFVTNYHVVSSGTVIQPNVRDETFERHNELGDIDFAVPIFAPGLFSGALIAHVDASRGGLHIRQRNHSDPVEAPRGLQFENRKVDAWKPLAVMGSTVSFSGATSGTIAGGRTIFSSGLLTPSAILAMTLGGPVGGALASVSGLIGGVTLFEMDVRDGDSGSLIQDDSGDFVALLWGGSPRGPTFNDPGRFTFGDVALNVIVYMGITT